MLNTWLLLRIHFLRRGACQLRLSLFCFLPSPLATNLWDAFGTLPMTMSLWEAQLAAHAAQHGRDDNDDDGYTSPIERHDRESTTRALQPIPVNGQGDKAPTPSSSPGKRAPSVSRPLPPNEPVVESGNHPRFFGARTSAAEVPR